MGLVWLDESRALCLAPEEVEQRLLERAAAAEAASDAAGLALDALTPLERCAWTGQGAVDPAARGSTCLCYSRAGKSNILMTDETRGAPRT